MDITIHDVTQENVQEILNLRVGEAQQNFIETTRQCLDEAKECANFKPVGLYSDSCLIGFAMYGHFSEGGEKGRVWLDRFLIDAKYQGFGYGKTMLNAMIQKLVDEFSCNDIYLSVYEENKAAIRLYEKFDFRFNGESDENNEKIMVKIFPNLNGQQQ
ncbi:spermidine acetyltransferase [Solibacillus sp. R5-41]|uniref:GNAT family N-acetyltransferase n=1 Tax=Solibacillus sp. R5-41 TaxID=2048654 RepID=UPI000C12992D|nr:GNAT family N-acetyltransferase [Solibacillus sp. R5-41]ATP39022.1 spermidine acetyltransferase [Solibacillus sp. R5-41]